MTRYIESKEIAKQLKKEFKAAWPSVKFSVTSDFSQVRIEWTDGPTYKEVDEKAQKYRGSTWDSMQDLSVKRTFTWVDGETVTSYCSYLSISRDFSAGFLQKCVDYAAQKWGFDAKEIPVKTHGSGSAYIDGNLRVKNEYASNLIRKEASEIDALKPFPVWAEVRRAELEAYDREREERKLAEEKAIADNPCDITRDFIGKSWDWEGGKRTVVGVTPRTYWYGDECRCTWYYEIQTPDGKTKMDFEAVNLLLYPIVPDVFSVEPFFIEAKFARSNKNNTLEEYIEECFKPQEGNWDIEKAKISELVVMSQREYNLFCDNLLASFDWLKGKGGCGSTTAPDRDVDTWDYTDAELEQWRKGAYRKCLAIVTETNCFLVDPLGYSYARYVGLVESKAGKDAIAAKLQEVLACKDATPAYQVVSEVPAIEPVTVSLPQPKRMGVTVSVLRNSELGDCTLGGITSTHSRLLLVGEGVPPVSEESDSIPVVVLVRREHSDGTKYYFARPEGEAHWMMGGNFIYCSDSRFREITGYPIPVHDRCENPIVNPNARPEVLRAKAEAMRAEESKQLELISVEANEILETRRDRWEEKRERKLEAYERLKEKHENLSATHYEASNRIANVIPFGQPILVGHHSENRHRRDLDRIHNNMGKSIEHQKTAEYYAGKLAAMEANEAISSDDPDAIAKLESKLANMQECQELMKAANKIVRKQASDEDRVKELMALGLGEGAARKLLRPDFCGRYGYPDFKLSNNNGNMRRVKERIEELKAKLVAAVEESRSEEQLPELGLTIVRNREIDRLQLVFDAKPSEEVRSILKSHGFRWSPSEAAWQRLLNNGAESSALWAIERIKKLDR